MDEQRLEHLIGRLESLGVMTATALAMSQTVFELQARLLAATEGRELSEVEAETKALFEKNLRHSLDRQQETFKNLPK